MYDYNLYERSMKENVGKEMHKRNWRQKALEQGIEFLCRDIDGTNRAWYRFSCGHIGTGTMGDVSKGIFRCRVCLIDKYKENCKDKNLEFIELFTEGKQSMIKSRCLGCGKINNYRVSSITHHNAIKCEICFYKKYQAIASENNFVFIGKSKSHFGTFKCIRCVKTNDFRYSDVSKGEFACQCELDRRWNTLSDRIVKKSDRLGFTFEGRNYDDSELRCNKCSTLSTFQNQAILRDNVRCRVCNPRKSTGQKMVENYLLELGLSLGNEITYSDLIGLNGNRLRYDIGITIKNNVVALIEYDGQQHYEHISFGNWSSFNIERYERQRQYDKIKDDYAKYNNIPLLRIAYNDKEWKDKIIEFLGGI